ncbi:hypothetical protein [Mucilaginibacter sp.]|uniref:hypothetical protein n=1 Tax=Mucilaginibacter sp. TaxID=1882438 RepID=UPI003B006635
MPKLKFTYFLFFLAAMFFVAKPFVGFRLRAIFSKSSGTKSVCVKSFTKRKPEYLEEADSKKAEISAKLNNPPLTELFTMLQLMAILFLCANFLQTVWHFFYNRFYKSRQLYLLTGKLII